MKSIEPARLQADDHLTNKIRDFWVRNVNAERIYGRTVSAHQRGADRYFEELEQQRFRSHRHLMAWIEAMHPGRSVLEVGCGVGLDTFALAAHGLQVTAVDLTEVGVATAKSRFDRSRMSGDFAVADACHLPFEDNRFDYVYSFGVLHHVADTAQSIRQILRVLRPGGEARVMLYHRRSLNEVVHRLTRIPFEEKAELCPVVRRFTRAEARRLFSDYSEVHVHADYLYGEGYGALFRMTPLWLYMPLSRLMGWHLMIRAIK